MSEINDLKNQRQEIILENNKVSFDALAGYEIPMDKIESKLKSFKEMEKQTATEQQESWMERMMIEMQLHMKRKREDKAIKSDYKVLKIKLRN